MPRHQDTFHALGSEAALTVVTNMNGVYAKWLLSKLRQSIAEFEQRFSRFIPDSELTKFNARAGESTRISALFRRLLTKSQELSKQTDGLYNPFMLPALQKAGYKGSWPEPDNVVAGTDFENRSTTDSQDLIIGDSWALIPENSALDLGGIGKGYLLDSLCKTISDRNVTGYWLSLGGDIICLGHDVDGQVWRVGVQSATEPIGNVAFIENGRGATLGIATSGTTKRRGVSNGTPWHHIIDPRTGLPAKTDILTATVSAKNAVVADVYAKIAVIAGSKAAVHMLRGEQQIESYVLQLEDGTVLHD